MSSEKHVGGNVLVVTFTDQVVMGRKQSRKWIENITRLLNVFIDFAGSSLCSFITNLTDCLMSWFHLIKKIKIK